MPSLSYKKFLSQIKKLNENVFLFNGDENYLKDECVRMVLKKYEGQYDDDFDISTFEGAEVKDAEIIGELDSVPMMSDLKIVIIHNIDKTSVKAKNALKKWLDEPNSKVLLLSTTSERVSPQKVKFFEKFEEAGILVNCYKFESEDMAKWINEQFQLQKKAVDSQAVDFMIDMVGFDLYKMHNEIKKIVLFLKDRKDVKVGDVTKVVSDIRSDSVFDLIDAIMFKDHIRALRMVPNIIKDRSDQGILLVSLLTRQIKNVAMYSSLSRQNTPDGLIAQKIGINPYFLRGIREQAYKIGDTDIFAFFNKLLTTDIKLKSSPLSCNAVIEGLVLDFCGI